MEILWMGNLSMVWQVDGLTVIWIYYSNKDISVGQEGKHIVSVIWLNFTKQLLINHQKIVFHVLSWSWCKLGNKMLSKSRYYCNNHMLLLVHNCFHSILNYDTVQWLHQGFFFPICCVHWTISLVSSIRLNSEMNIICSFLQSILRSFE